MICKDIKKWTNGAFKSFWCITLSLMSEESLSGDPLSHYGQGQAEHSFEDFDGYNFD